MANQQMSEFVELIVAAPEDFIGIVDVSDTTDSPQGTTKRITLVNLAGALLAIGSGASEFIITEGED